MKLAFSLLILAACLGGAPAQASNLNKTSTLTDDGSASTTILGNVPLMQGLQPEADDGFIRLLSKSVDSQPVVTMGAVDVDDVYNFYKRALPPLGWEPVNGHEYTHGDKTLRIDAHADGKTSTVTFTEETTGP